MSTLFLLLVLFQLKHLFADYFLQGEYMLQKFKPDWSFFKPLLAHVGVHATFTFLISIFFVSWHVAVLLAIVDAFIHFIMDRLKAGPKYLGRFKPVTASEYMANKATIANGGETYDSFVSARPCVAVAEAKDKLRGNKLFWWSLGLDQMIHHLTHYGIIYLIIVLH